MIRALSYILSIAVAIAAAVWLADRPGEMTLTWRGWRVDTSAAFLVFCVAAVAVATALLYRLWRALRRAPQAFMASRRASRQQRGYQSLTQGMVAVAAGDPQEALRQARRADSLLGEPPLTMLLSAQAAQLNGDEAAARSYFTAMLERPETAFLGLRGLLIQSQRDGDRPAALGFARRAYELRPKTPWVLTTLFDLQVGEGRWRQALATLEEAIRRKAIGASDGQRRRVTVLLGCSGEAEQAGNAPDALAHARKAYAQAPGFLPAVIRLVSLMIAGGKKRPAARVIHNAWGRTPHPELARIYGAMDGGPGGGPGGGSGGGKDGGGDAVRKLGRFERLLTFNPDHAESHIALAEAALEARMWGTARSHLEKLGGEKPGGETPGGERAAARVCRLMAELEEGEHGDMAAVRRWLLRAASAEPDPAWTCNGCGVVSAQWTPLCAKCAALGSLEWRPPERVRGLVLRPPVGAAAGAGAAVAAVSGPAGSGPVGGDADTAGAAGPDRSSDGDTEGTAEGERAAESTTEAGEDHPETGAAQPVRSA